LTKPLVTGLLAAQRVEEADLTLNTPIADVIAEFGWTEKGAITVGQLATHTSRFKDWIPLYLKAPNLLHVIDAIIGEKLLGNQCDTVVYSDLNFITLARAVEQIAAFRIDIAYTDVVDSLELARTGFTPLTPGSHIHRADKSMLAAAEFGNEYEKQTCIEKGYLQPPATAGGTDMSSAFRDYQIWGKVHDGNAYFMGGVAGHAGLFSTAEEVFKIALQFLPQYTTLLKPDTCELFRTNFTKGMNEDRSFAFQLASTEGSTAGTKMSPESFGHNGFTGASLWIDPVNDRIFILLTNRTHNHALPFVNINSVRRSFHDIAIEELDRR